MATYWMQLSRHDVILGHGRGMGRAVSVWHVLPRAWHLVRQDRCCFVLCVCVCLFWGGRGGIDLFVEGYLNPSFASPRRWYKNIMSVRLAYLSVEKILKKQKTTPFVVQDLVNQRVGQTWFPKKRRALPLSSTKHPAHARRMSSRGCSREAAQQGSPEGHRKKGHSE